MGQFQVIQKPILTSVPTFKRKILFLIFLPSPDLLKTNEKFIIGYL
jgi:hypothetical protein